LECLLYGVWRGFGSGLCAKHEGVPTHPKTLFTPTLNTVREIFEFLKAILHIWHVILKLFYIFRALQALLKGVKKWVFLQLALKLDVILG